MNKMYKVAVNSYGETEVEVILLKVPVYRRMNSEKDLFLQLIAI